VKIITLLAAVALIFASCGSSPAPESPAGAKPVPGQIPVEKRAVVKFADGTIDEFTISEYDPSDITLLGQNRFSASGGLMDQIEYTYDEERNMLTNKMTKDDENRIKSRIVYVHDENTNRLLRETVVNKAGKAVSTNEYTYNPAGFVASRAILNGNNVKLAETFYTYKGDLVVSSKTQAGDGRPISSSTNEYDRDGNLINQVLYNAAGNITRRISTVWQNGYEVETIQTTADGKPQLRITNEYGAAGELLRKKVENYQGESTQVIEFEYEFRPDHGRT
jgi:PBP1b-binding outer membrane lipoprotein LpoB